MKFDEYDSGTISRISPAFFFNIVKGKEEIFFSIWNNLSTYSF